MQIFLLFVGGESTTCPLANITCLQMMVCSRTMLSNCVWVQIIMSSCVNETALFSFLQSLLHKSNKMTEIVAMWPNDLRKSALKQAIVVLIKIRFAFTGF